MFRSPAISTCWNSHRHADGLVLLKELAGLGFDAVELSHGIKVTLVEGILRGVEQGVVSVRSCHNFCPLPSGITTASPNLYVPSSKDSRERAQWIRHTRKSIDFAAQVGAELLVLHLGRVDFFWFNPSAKLERASEGRSRQELMADKAYLKTLDAAKERLRKAAPVYWTNVKLSLQEVLPYAASKRVRLCIENREAFDELPLDDGFAELMAAFQNHSEALACWHDTGHAAIKHAMGVIDHERHLQAVASHLAGFHLHDVSLEGRDHQAIGTGVVDWSMIRQFLQPNHQLVIELSPRLKPEEVVASREALGRILAGSPARVDA